MKGSQTNLYYTSLEEATLNQKLLLSVGSIIYVIVDTPNTLIRLENHQLGQLLDSFKIKSAPKRGSSMVLKLITGMVCVFALFGYASYHEFNLLGSAAGEAVSFLGKLKKMISREVRLRKK